MPEQSIKDKTVKGVGWSALDNVSRYVVTFIVGIVLARLLSPDDYGLIGLTSIVTAICEIIIYGGFGNALIRKKIVTDDDYNTVFLVNFVMSLLLYVIIYLCSPLIANFFNRQELIPITRISSLGLIIGAVSLVQNTRLTKQLDFKTQTKITVATTIPGGIIGIIMAFLGFGVWSLVAQNLLSQIMRSAFLWLHNKWLPKLRFSLNSFNELFGFGWKIMLSNLIDTIWKELYQVVVGKFYSPATLGQYTRAKGYSQLFSSNLTGVIQRVTYPVLSEIQDDKYRMISAYRRIIKDTMLITSICMFSLGAISGPLLYCMIGPKWNEASTYLPLICIASSLYPINSINLNMLQVQGRSDLFLLLEIIKKTIALIPLLIGAFVGIMPMLYVNLVTGMIAFFLNTYYSGKFLGYTSWMQLKDIAPSYGIATVIALSVFFLKYLPISNWIILPLQIVTGICVCLTLCRITKLEEYYDVRNIILSFGARFKHIPICRI